MVKIETLSIIYHPPKILLGMKKGKFGKGKYNGFGGKLKDDETLLECVVRETYEECGITILDPHKMGEILFTFEGNEPDHFVHFYRSRKFDGTPIETDEMTPEWFNVENIPYDKMWPDDKYWMPMILQDEKFKGKFDFTSNGKIKDYQLTNLGDINKWQF